MADTEPQPEQPKKKRSWSPWAILGRAMAAMGLLGFAREICEFDLYGRLADWHEAYSNFVNGVGDFLFGWIDLWWVGVSRLEHHAIVLSTLIASASLRAMYTYVNTSNTTTRYTIDNTKLTATKIAFGTTAFTLVFQFLIYIFLPSILSIPIVIVVLMGFITNKNYDHPLDSRQFAPGDMVRREVAWSFGGFVILLLLNYSVFRIGE